MVAEVLSDWEVPAVPAPPAVPADPSELADPVSSAHPTPGVATAIPTPNATANPPTRPMYLALLITVPLASRCIVASLARCGATDPDAPGAHP